MQVCSGQLFDPAALDGFDFTIEDIAASLSKICRFRGHVMGFYSVAQHSLAVSKRVSSRTDDSYLEMVALLHDAHEAYLGDEISHFRTPERIILEESVQSLIEGELLLGFERSLTDEEKERLRYIDRGYCRVEALALLPSPPKNGWCFRYEPLEFEEAEIESIRDAACGRPMHPSDVAMKYVMRYRYLLRRLEAEGEVRSISTREQ